VARIKGQRYPRTYTDIARPVTADVRLALTFKVGRSRRRPTDMERDAVAAAAVEHLQLGNWLIERGPPAQDGMAYGRG
jgi:hypothetical protein